ncbi:hypothetical protein F4861DRAFT_549703, partial [Xylaria intraflava]
LSDRPRFFRKEHNLLLNNTRLLLLLSLTTAQQIPRRDGRRSTCQASPRISPIGHNGMRFSLQRGIHVLNPPHDGLVLLVGKLRVALLLASLRGFALLFIKDAHFEERQGEHTT